MAELIKKKNNHKQRPAKVSSQHLNAILDPPHHHSTIWRLNESVSISNRISCCVMPPSLNDCCFYVYVCVRVLVCVKKRYGIEIAVIQA